MKEYKEDICSNCKHYKGVTKGPDNGVYMICGKLGLRRPLSNFEQAETVGAVKYGCFEERIKTNDEILQLKPNFYGIGLDVKKLWKKITKRR
jgi:hypothetical protein